MGSSAGGGGRGLSCGGGRRVNVLRGGDVDGGGVCGGRGRGVDRPVHPTPSTGLRGEIPTELLAWSWCGVALGQPRADRMW